MSYNDLKFEQLVGMTLTSVINNDDEIVFVTDDDRTLALYHYQDCCESVYVESIVGELEWLVGTPILSAYEECSSERPFDLPEPDYSPESQTWTFYRLTTVKGTVVIRFYGSSNGYYSETVSFIER